MVQLGSQPFSDAATQVVRDIRDAVRAALGAAPGMPERAQAVADSLKIDLNLAWKLVNVIRTPDPFAAAQQLPGSGGLEIFLEAAAACGVPSDRLANCRAAFKNFEALIEIHAGDRAALDSMFGHLASRGSERADLAARRAAFKANAAIVGVQSRVQVTTYLLHPTASDAERYDVTMLRGFVGLQRLRGDIGWIIGRTRHSDDALPDVSNQRRPLDPEAAAAHHGVPLIARSCSTPMPVFRRTLGADKMFADELVEGPVGKTAALTFFTGETILTAGNRRGLDDQSHLRIAAGCHTPVESMVVDLLVHADLTTLVDPSFSLVSELGGAQVHSTPPERFSRLPTCETLEQAGRGADELDIAEHPRYIELLTDAANTVSVNLRDFNAHRVRIKFPPIPCSAVVQWKVSM